MVWRISTNVVTANAEGELVLLHRKTGQFYGLDSVGTKVWQLLEQPRCLEQLVVALQAEYGVAEEVLRTDLHALLLSLEAAQLVTRA